MSVVTSSSTSPIPSTSASPSPTDLASRIDVVMARDVRALRRALADALSLTDPDARDSALGAFNANLETAEQKLRRRRESVPRPTYPAALPITERHDELLAALADNQVVIVAGETGSGKSTQLPKLCLELGRGVRGLIGHTQPRRLAARTVAERVAEELGTTLGGTVGYTVRFTDQVGENTLIRLMTDGILLNEIQRDRTLSRYDTIIVDEAHERSLNIDFILGYLSQLLPQRPDLKVIVTSATIDTERFSRHFGGAPVVAVTGRTYPVELRYRPLSEEADQIQGICDAVTELCAEGPGDVLVFLSGEREIRDAADALAALALPGTELLPLYARLSATEQHRVFQPHDKRRVVLATNVAETSLTVPGIRSVVDPGTARISRYNRRTKVQRLPIEAVSRASADQRAGRCGRVAPGICIRLYDEDGYDARPAFTEPEILRTNLASVILQMTALGLGDIAAFPFVEPPDGRSIRDGVALLEELGALDPAKEATNGWLTPLGRRLARLPLDPRLGRMVLEADELGCVRDVLIITAALSIQDPRERPADKLAAAQEQHRRFVVGDDASDFLSYLRLWNHVSERRRALSSSAFRRLCRTEYLNYLRVREWQDIFAQLRSVARDLKLRVTETAPVALAEGEAETELRLDADRIHRALLAGLLSHIGLRDPERNDYQGARAARFALAGRSNLARKAPRWVMVGELVETNRLWGSVAARIQPDWVESLAGPLLSRSYGDPQWDPRRGTAVTTERATLYGLPVIAGRRIDYARIDPAEARQIFIHHALVGEDWPNQHRVLAENRERLTELRLRQDRARRREVAGGEQALHRFYDTRLAGSVTAGRHFDQWWKQQRAIQPNLLRAELDDLLAPGAEPVYDDDYPDTWACGSLNLDVSYLFAPGDPEDGVTVRVPLNVLNQLVAAGFDWQVPGLREDLVSELFRLLPKPLRRPFVPVLPHTREFLAAADPTGAPLREQLARWVGRRTGQPVPPDCWAGDRLAPHLRVTYLVVDPAGNRLVAGKDLTAVKASLEDRMRSAINRAAPSIERAGIRTWDFGRLPRVVETDGAEHRVRGYPALVDEGDTVALRLCASVAEQDEEMWAGTRRLLRLAAPSPARLFKGAIGNQAKLALTQAGYRSLDELYDDTVDAVLDATLANAGGPVWDETGFAALAQAAKGDLASRVAGAASELSRILAATSRVHGQLLSLTAPALQFAVADVRRQLDGLVYPGFVSASGPERLVDVTRYLAGMERRLNRLGTDAARDQRLTTSVQRLEHRYEQLLNRLSPAQHTTEVAEIHWMLEELRISLFAQLLGTAYPISEKRIEAALTAAS